MTGLLPFTLPKLSEMGTLLCGAASVNGLCRAGDGSDILTSLRKSRASTILVDPTITSGPWTHLQKFVKLAGKDGAFAQESGHDAILSKSDVIKLRQDTDVLKITSEEIPDLKEVYFIRRVEGGGEGDFLAKLNKLQDWFEADDVTQDDVCTAYNSSGSTGFNKFVVHTHGSLLRTIERLRNVMKDPKENTDIDLNVTFMGWIGGYPSIHLCSNLTRVLFDDRAGLPDDVPAFIARCVNEEKCTLINFNIPRHYILQMLDRFQISETENDPDKMNSKRLTWDRKLSYAFVCGIPLTRNLMSLVDTLAHGALLSYATSETGVCAAAMVTSKDFDSFEENYSGKPLPGVEIRVVSMDDDEKDLPAGERGYIQVKNQWLFKEYLNDPETTAAAFTGDGFFRTGDVGRLMADKRLIVEGRGSDAINQGGLLIYPSWIEARMRACPVVFDVIVVGVPSPLNHEELCACVVLTSDHVTTKDVHDWVERNIVDSDCYIFKEVLCGKPRHYLAFEKFPTTITGKPDRRTLKEQAAQRLLAI